MVQNIYYTASTKIKPFFRTRHCDEHHLPYHAPGTDQEKERDNSYESISKKPKRLNDLQIQHTIVAILPWKAAQDRYSLHSAPSIYYSHTHERAQIRRRQQPPANPATSYKVTGTSSNVAEPYKTGSKYHKHLNHNKKTHQSS